MTNLNSIHIVTATNDKYAKHLGVMLNSLLENKAEKADIQIHIIDGKISSSNKSNLRRVVNKFKLKVNFLTVDYSLFNGFKVKKNHLSKETYYRIVIPDLMDKSIKKVLYLDCDLIVKEDISKLWNTKIDHYHLAAVEKATLKDSERKALEIPKGSSYFNAGVLLMNLEKWRDQKISSKVLQYINDNSKKIKYCSQDPLNAILHNKWIKLDPKWNYTTRHFKIMPNIKPAIIHFTGQDKPWNKGHPLQHEYYKYLHTTSWK
ncbi:glycosyltransferase family 8 protein [Paenibacillus sp. GP183]|uniref:glycosyltransferase family 8 protein n=1 Tax=Paenibacillus sp. GP183 TaxID=1882751 RepID=UPI00089CACF5|nr:glycosyltransferase family 8 protein [Paenibacillus sp. GP183]SEC69544.1 Lipopolysaccharide biosynthesis protein, LPS:glycosyltransferase [Paenibacillus sp. GP183]